MARLIDADVLLLELEEELSHKSLFFTTEQNELIDVGLRIAAGDIRHQPTVDAVEVVRCRDCKQWGDEDGKLQGSDGVLFARCKAHNYLIDGRHTGWCPSENDFCSYGERNGGDADA